MLPRLRDLVDGEPFRIEDDPPVGEEPTVEKVEAGVIEPGPIKPPGDPDPILRSLEAPGVRRQLAHLEVAAGLAEEEGADLAVPLGHEVKRSAESRHVRRCLEDGLDDELRERGDEPPAFQVLVP